MDNTHYIDSGAIEGDGLSCQKEFVLLQYTGLKDKNGKEIYEGDLLNTKTTFENNLCDSRYQENTIVKVSFDKGQFINEFTKNNLYDEIRIISSYIFDLWTDYEVIGNIYENPELLTYKN